MPEKTKMTILVVDDTAENVTLLSRILKMSGYNIEVANGGALAIEKAKSLLPDLIVLDINMPEMDGIETCVRLKEDERTREIPVIFISALDSIEDKVRAFRAGGVDYILKPFDYEEVQARVETHLVIRCLRLQLESTNRDLAERINEVIRSRELLAERERKLSAFVAALPNLPFILNEEGCFLEVLANETGLLPAKPDKLIGFPIEKVFPPQTAALMMDAIRQAIQTGNIQIIEYEIPVVDGNKRWFEGRVTLMEKDDAGHSKVIFVATEISERIQLYQEVQRLANEDVLTSCCNRRHFMVLATQELHRTIRYKRPISLLMLDIDHFKGFNDRYGHQIGDQLLVQSVSLCKKLLRGVDIMGRYGGDEFIIVMPETDVEGALRTSELLRKEIGEMKVDTPKGKLSVTVSMGLASLDRGFDDGLAIDNIIKRADDALYDSKATGRDCVRAWQDEG